MAQSFFLHDPDVLFFTLFALLGFGIVLSDELRYLVYLAFFRVDFTHARIAATVLLPLSALSAIFVHELLGGEQASVETHTRRRHVLALVTGGALAIGSLLMLDRLAQTVTDAWFGQVKGLELSSSWVISTSEVGRIVVALIVFVVLLGVNWLARHVDLVRSAGRIRARWRAGQEARASVIRLVPAYMLGCLMVSHAFGNTYAQFNGEHTKTYPVPFVGNNSFTVPADVLIPPGPAARQAVRERLETDEYRSITVAATDGYPTYDTRTERGYSAFVALFWQLRLANGYMGLSRQIVSLPWPDANKTLRGISFTDQNTLPWPLLAALNVKYAVVANPSLMFNVPADPARRGVDAGTEDLIILENPLPVVPRAFFAAAVTPRAFPAPPTVTLLPVPPTAFRATALPYQSIGLSWVGEVADATYQIERRQLAPTPEPASVQVAQTNRGANTFFDQGRPPGSVYEYQIRTCDRRGCGELSAPVQVAVAVASTEAPHALTVASRSASEVLASWEPVDEGASTILEILTGTGAVLGPAVELPPGARSYIVSGLRPLRDYAIRLRACTLDGCSPHTAPRLVSMPSSLTASELDGIIPADPARESLVEGLDEPLTLGTATGPIRADFHEPDRIRIDVDAADIQRFLVLNELYHPNWHAYASGPGGETELRVWPTNAVMRGIQVPSGVTRIELRFEPFMLRWPALVLILAGLLLGAACWLGLRSLDRSTAAS
jgi:hypothetical protein